ncbi:Aft1 HRA domain-containing protein [Boeremia exigua]|uniref:Aft1 HRA domain-containing protein n=1 Tax=Boeremia exigua TaxID=749465 RepID=UPI001E8EC3DF|nr:Aft1 HRA domain-containing protein [Boeremia exigua]KAH6621909.1 Aft1 HRA domain-containing protein [Boeremia exigua]
MAAATQTARTSPPNSKMSSPKDGKGTLPLVTKTEEPAEVKTDIKEIPTVSEPINIDAKPATSNAAPLAPPPKPSAPGETADYFNTVHNPFSLEPNVFEQSFGGNGSVETPGGRTILPPVANITSPNPLPGITPGWQSLRAGPLSPAMLSGPTGQTDYFSESFRGFPTPNESSLRTGLTPGGGGSMFPAPSPNTQAIFNLQSAGVTPGTGDFQQAALRAAAQANQNKTTVAPTSQPDTVTAGMDRQNNYQQAQQQQQQRSQNDPYANHDVSSAANDLLSFASQNGGGARNNQPPFSMAPNNQSVNAGHMPVQPVGGDHSRRNTKGSINSMASADTGDFSESGQSEQNKGTRTRGKKGAANGKQAAGTKRKADDMPKGGRKKGAAATMDDEDDSDDEMQNLKEEEFDSKGRKMTDEEKRKNFLERNRVAALKCRQRKKQWLANLQAKVELFSTENDALSATVTQLREEIVNLKTLLLAHKDCPVSQAQGLHGNAMNNFLGSDVSHQNPYGIAQLQHNGVHHMGMPMQGQMMNR